MRIPRIELVVSESLTPNRSQDKGNGVSVTDNEAVTALQP